MVSLDRMVCVVCFFLLFAFRFALFFFKLYFFSLYFSEASFWFCLLFAGFAGGWRRSSAKLNTHRQTNK